MRPVGDPEADVAGWRGVTTVGPAFWLATAAHTAHEAGFINFGQVPVANLTWLVRPGTPWSSLLTGMLGIQPRPVLIEAVLWVGYLIPMLTFVLMPRKRLAVVNR